MIRAYWRQRGGLVVCVFVDDPDAGVLVRSDLGGNGLPRRRLAAAE